MVREQNFTTLEGTPSPLGATVQPSGVNFAIASATAKDIFLCLFSDNGKKELKQIKLKKTGSVFHIFVKDLKDGQLYGYRADGKYSLKEGLRFNKNKLLVDPYARALHGGVTHHKANHDNNTLDNKSYIPKSIVVKDSKFDWENTKKPQTGLNKTFIYEAHVRGMTMLAPDVPKNKRGTFLGMCHKSIIKHLKELGITTIELMPIQSFISEEFLIDKGLSNYWGYTPFNYFCIHKAYGEPKDLKEMIKTFHKNDIEVVMDVVYNHTCESGINSPTYSFRGIDNSSYYVLDDEDKCNYENPTGCGNSLNFDSDITLNLVIDSMKYFASEFQIDGFRFDLATTLMRDLGTIEKSRFLDIVGQDELLSNLKLIAEPWDMGPSGYQLGRFKDNFCEWNDLYRRSVRAFWRGGESQANNFARTISGSEDIFKHHDNQALASINFITAHDGFTLQDLVSYNDKHNEANLEHNKDGNDYGLSCNYGEEGKTKNKDILALRIKQKKNMMATLIFSKGVPMILSGDEIGNSQQGNNNAYCQNNEISWLNWDKITKEDLNFYKFIKNTIEFRMTYSKLIHYKFLNKDNAKWYSPVGSEMTAQDWETPFVKCLGVLANNRMIFLFNSHTGDIDFKLPFAFSGELLFNSNEANSFKKEPLQNISKIKLPAQSMMIIKVKRG